MEEAFDSLDGPIRLVSGRDVPIPYSPPLERAALPQEEDVVEAVRGIMGK
jgi:pyruvate/2-oxoglutarate/acetoin dehydrogenase E1 component